MAVTQCRNSLFIVIFPVWYYQLKESESVSCSVLPDSSMPWTIVRQAPLSVARILASLQARILEWVVISFSRRIFPTQESNMGLLHCRQILYWLSHQRSPNGRWMCPFPSRIPSRCPEWATVKFFWVFLPSLHTVCRHSTCYSANTLFCIFMR